VGPRRTAPISSRRTFEALGASGHRGRSGPLAVRFVPAEDGDESRRVAYAISRKAGGAVRRNRIRRRLRSAVDAVAEEMAAGAYLITPDRTTIDMAFTALINSLRASLLAAGAIREDHR